VDQHALVLALERPATLEEITKAAGKLKDIRGALRYWRGDLINLAEKLHPEQASQIVDADTFGDEAETNADRLVASKVDLAVRRASPSWEHSRAVAHLAHKDQVKWIQKALDEDWIASKLKTEVQAAEVGGKTGMRFLLIVDAGTEAKQTKLAATLEKDGYKVTLRTGIKREAKAKKPKKLKAGAVTARAKKGGRRPYAPRKSARSAGRR